MEQAPAPKFDSRGKLGSAEAPMQRPISRTKSRLLNLLLLGQGLELG